MEGGEGCLLQPSSPPLSLTHTHTHIQAHISPLSICGGRRCCAPRASSARRSLCSPPRQSDEREGESGEGKKGRQREERQCQWRGEQSRRFSFPPCEESETQTERQERERTAGVSQMEWNGFKMVRKEAAGSPPRHSTVRCQPLFHSVQPCSSKKRRCCSRGGRTISHSQQVVEQAMQ